MNDIDLDHLADTGKLKMEDAQAMHGVLMRQNGITEPDEVVADWNRRDPAAPWGSGIVGDYVEQLTAIVIAFMADKIEDARRKKGGTE